MKQKTLKTLSFIGDLEKERKRKSKLQSVRDKFRHKQETLAFRKAHPKRPDAYHWEEHVAEEMKAFYGIAKGERRMSRRAKRIFKRQMKQKNSVTTIKAIR